MRVALAIVCGVLLGVHSVADAQEVSRFKEDLEVGKTLFQVGEYERAIPYFQRALEAKKGAPEAVVPYGIALQKTGKHQEAIAVLQGLSLGGPRGAEGAFYLGEAYKAVGDNEAARKAYRQASELNGPLSNRALLAAGQLSIAVGDFDTAQRDFERLLQLEAAGELAGAAKAGLAELESRKKNRFAAMADLGVRYDSNVRLDAENTAANSGGLRVVMNAQGRYRLLETPKLRSEAALQINQGRYLKAELRPFDLGVHRLYADLMYRVGSLPIRVGADVDGIYQTLDFANYNLGFGAGPRMLVAEGAHFATSFSWHWRKDDFQNDLRDGINRRTQLNQFAFWGKSGYAGLGGSYEITRGQGNDWKYNITSARIFAGDIVGPGIMVDGALDFSITSYLEGLEREDKTLTLSAGVGKFWGNWGTRVSLAYVTNTSENVPVGANFDFSKQIVGVDARWRF